MVSCKEGEPVFQRLRTVYIDFQSLRVRSARGLLRHVLTSIGVPLDQAEQDCQEAARFEDAMTRHCQGPLVLVMDEFDIALDANRSQLPVEVWDCLRSLATALHGRLAFVTGSVRDPIPVSEDAGLLSPFFNTLGTAIDLGPFAVREADEFIQRKCPDVSTADAQYLKDTSRLWPLFLQILCRERQARRDPDGSPAEGWKSRGESAIARYPHLLKRRKRKG